MPKKKRTNPHRLSLRLNSATIKRDYEDLAANSPFSLNGLVELAMEWALPHLRDRVRTIKHPPRRE